MLKISKIIFIICAVYFFQMGIGLIFLPRYLVNGFSNVDVNPTIIGMLRGAGGSILPYSLLYISISLEPVKRSWALYVICLANIIAIALDLGSLLLGEYTLAYAMIDIPVELLSIIGIVMIWITKGRMKANL
jgi:hypothetical protein